ncbi:putative polyamine transporter [Quercus suber]|uniref:Polyamine transporter n=1 Tax=Quercus suber TaxID=58331 RepID=A0AAW0L3L5_QUESU
MVQHPLGWNFVINFNFTRGFIHEFHRHYILSQFLVQFEHVMREFSSFVWLRRKFPMLKRPYRVPLRLPMLVFMCLVPCAFLVVIMAFATKKVYLVSGILTVAGTG